MARKLTWIKCCFDGQKKIPHKAGLGGANCYRALEFAHIEAKNGSADDFNCFA